MNPAIERLFPFGYLLLGAAVLIAVISLWERSAVGLGRLWLRYHTWATKGLRRLHLPYTSRGMATYHCLLIVGGAAFGYWQIGVGTSVFLGVVGIALPFLWMQMMLRKRSKALEGQLDAGLQIVSNNMLATQNLVDGFAALATHSTPPLSQEAELFVKDVKVGSRVEEALANLGERCQNQHIDSVVTAATIGLRTGGDIGKVFKRLSEVIRETLRVEGMIAAKTSEGRSSAILIGLMPIVVLFFLHQSDPTMVDPLFNEPAGTWILGVATALDLIGVFLIIWLTRIDP